MKKPDILIFISDQHGADFCEWGSVKVDTPVLNQIRREGTMFEEAYTSCPLCVPARMSMMSSLLPSHTGIYGNSDVIPNTTPCFPHSLAAAGYETVLIGRMHFVGEDQRHGFMKRLAPDITPVSWTMPVEKMREERGDLQACTAAPWCTNYVGAGESPVMHYDRMVVDTALNYLKEDHEKPQFILVGTYGPHFPYITSKALYKKYYARVQKPEFFETNSLPEYLNGFDVLNRRVKEEDVTWEVARGALAAYCGLIELMDGQIGELKEAFEQYEKRNTRTGVFGYLSDHGDTAGERRMYGKQTYFDKSVKIPMMFTGVGIPAGKVVKEPVSIMDLGPTICELGGTSFEIGDGISLLPYMNGKALPDRIIVSQFVEYYQNKYFASMMLRYQNYKYISYHRYEDYDLLFDMEEDPLEKKNLAKEKQELLMWFRQQRDEITSFKEMEKQKTIHDKNADIFKAYEAATGYDDSERWSGNPKTARGQLEIAAAQIPVKTNRGEFRI